MNKIGASEDDIESFITQVISYCQQACLTPQQIAHNLKPLVELSKITPLERIPQFIEEKQNQVNAVNQEIEELQKQKSDLGVEIFIKGASRDSSTGGEYDVF